MRVMHKLGKVMAHISCTNEAINAEVFVVLTQADNCLVTDTSQVIGVLNVSTQKPFSNNGF